MPDQQNQPQLMNQPQQPQQWGPRGPMQMGEGEHFLILFLCFNVARFIQLQCWTIQFIFSPSSSQNIHYLFVVS